MNERDKTALIKRSQAHFSHSAVGATRASASSRNAMVPAVRRQQEIQKRLHDAQAMKTCFEKRTGCFDLYNLTIYLLFTLQ